jgi:hypothetical protein
MAVLFDLARPLDPRDRIKFVEAVVADLDGHAEIDLGLIHRVPPRGETALSGLLGGMAMASLGCGPIAISLIISVPAEDVCKVLGSNGEDTSSGDLIPVLRHFNYQTRTVEDWRDEPRLAGPLVTSWLKRRPYHLRDAPLLLLAEFRGRPGWHWLAVRHMEDDDDDEAAPSHDEFADAWLTHRQWQRDLRPLACWRLRGAWAVTPIAVPECRRLLGEMIDAY